MLRALLLASLTCLPSGSLRAQTLEQLTSTPETTAVAFLRSVRAIRWSVTGQLLHGETLERFRTLVSMIAEADTTGGARQFLTGTDAGGFAALSGTEVFDRAIGAMIDEMPGLMHALYDRDDDVLGHGWRIRWSDELEVLDAALRGVRTGRR